MPVNPRICCLRGRRSKNVRTLAQIQFHENAFNILHEIKIDEDSLRFYFLDENAVERTERHGSNKPIDLTEPLI